jgi:hydrogenase maturation protease
MKLVVVGCGNILAGDDGIGIEVVKRLQTESLPDSVQVIEAGVPGLTLLDLMTGATKAIIIDAVFAGGQPGEIFRFTDADLPEHVTTSWSVHGIGLREALVWGRNFEPERMPAEIVIIGIQIASLEKWKIGLSPPLVKAVEQALEKVRMEIRQSLDVRSGP